MAEPTPELLPTAADGTDQADPAVAERLYAELKGIARGVLKARRCPGLLQTTALVHEGWMRLRGFDSSRWSDERSQFGALAVSVLRSVLVDEARREGRVKRGGAWRRVTLPAAEHSAVVCPHSIDLLDLDRALRELADLNRRRATVVELRFFGGMTVKQTAKILGVSKRTVEKEWEYARAWLRVRLAESMIGDSG